MTRPDVGDRVKDDGEDPEPRSGRALYIMLGTVRRTDDNTLVQLDPRIERTVTNISAGVLGSREEAMEKTLAFMRREFREDHGYGRHRAQAWDIPDSMIREAFAAIEKDSR